MATTVQIHRRCQVDVGERTADRRLLIDVGIQALIDMLGRTGGLPQGAVREGGTAAPTYTWEDANWLICYTRTEGAAMFRPPPVEVTILKIALKTRSS